MARPDVLHGMIDALCNADTDEKKGRVSTTLGILLYEEYNMDIETLIKATDSRYRLFDALVEVAKASGAFSNISRSTNESNWSEIIEA